MYNSTCTYLFMVHHLELDNQLMCTSLGKIISPNFSIP